MFRSYVLQTDVCFSQQKYYEISRALPLPPRRPGDLPVASSTENIYESIRDQETYGMVENSLKRHTKQATLTEAIAQELFTPSPTDDDATYAVVHDLKAPSDSDLEKNGSSQHEDDKFLSSALPVSPIDDNSKVLNRKDEGIIDESGYLLPKEDSDIDLSVFGMAFPSKQSSHLDKSDKDSGTPVITKHTSVVEGSGHLLFNAKKLNSFPRFEVRLGDLLSQSDDLPHRRTSMNASMMHNNAEMIKHTYFGYDDSNEDGCEDKHSIEDKEYCHIHPNDDSSRSKVAQCQKYETIGDPVSPPSEVDDIGYLVPSEDIQRKSRASLPPIPMKQKSSGDETSRLNLESEEVVKHTTGCVMGSDGDKYTADDLQIQHSYLELADVIQNLSVKGQEAGDSDHAKYSEITAETSTCDSKENTVKGKDGTGLLDQLPGLVDDLGYLVLSTEEQSESQIPVSSLVDDGGYLVPNIEHVDLMKRQTSQFVTMNPQNPGIDDIQHSYFGFNDSLSGTNGNRPDGPRDDIAYSEIGPDDDTSNKKKRVVYDSILP